MDDKKARKTAGALDVRNIIGTLIGVYGVILIAMGLFSDSTARLQGDVNANLYTGIALLVAGAVFLAWARLRPIVVPEDLHEQTTDREDTTPPPAEPR
jgi:hypothetical protein